MLKQFSEEIKFCYVCQRSLSLMDKRALLPDGKTLCIPCYELGEDLKKGLAKTPTPTPTHPEYNEPQHYHQHNIDTIKFLQEGFPKEVFMGFALGHIIKYAQRANYKNGREDYVKMVDYAKRALDWYDKTHS
jgi:hypothetical protein